MKLRPRPNDVNPNVGIISEIDGDWVLCDYDPVPEDYSRAMIHKSLCVKFTPVVGQHVVFCEDVDVSSSQTYLAVIPEGIYCYDPNGVCPFWSIDSNRHYQDNGYCSFLNIGDWEESPAFGLLWDQVKLCSENLDLDLDSDWIDLG